MPKFKATSNLMAGKNLRCKAGDVVEVSVEQAAPFVAKGLLVALDAAEVLPAEAQTVVTEEFEAESEPEDTDSEARPKGKKRGKSR